MNIKLGRVFLTTLFLATSALSTSASPVLDLQGTGTDADIHISFTPPITLDTPGFSGFFGNATVFEIPPGETFSQWGLSANSGVLRFTDLLDGNPINRTFEFVSFVNNGTYTTLSGPDTGILTVTGSTDAIPEPASYPLLAVGLGAFARSRIRRVHGRSFRALAHD